MDFEYPAGLASSILERDSKDFSQVCNVVYQRVKYLSIGNWTSCGGFPVESNSNESGDRGLNEKPAI
jgi:hypothetical protein